MLKILYFVYGACLASFLTLCAARIVTHQSIIVPRSHCDQCNRQLRNWQLIPILGYIMQHGRCHFCHKLISAFSTINEIALGLFFTTLPQYELTPSLAWICISSTLTFCAATDQFQHFIYSPSLIGFVPGLLILVRWNGFSLQNWLLLLATLLILGFFCFGNSRNWIW
ncbi:prepilin peptidase [Paucilactobacillus hokkaidonensis]|uniref:prepilin peptidase n=1 Tax=Paucilactobacillus hokkaidonensis TaxID=1193095 RepID=UPI0006D09057|nr:prepilin peptidase [Paucilactobacillus hokkaidonensis]